MKKIILLIIVFSVFIFFSCQNPFEAKISPSIKKENIKLYINQGYIVNEKGRLSQDNEMGDIYFYKRDFNYYFGIGWTTWDSGNFTPNLNKLYNFNQPFSNFNTIKYAPSYNSYVGEIFISPNIISNGGLFSIYTKDHHFGLIGIKKVELSNKEYIIFDYVYNPNSDNTYNLSYYEAE